MVDSLKIELDKHNIGGDTYQAAMVLEKEKRSAWDYVNQTPQYY